MQVILYILFIGLVALGGSLCAWAVKRNKGAGLKYASGVLTAISFLLLVLIPGGYYQVEAGEAALIKEFGQAKTVETAGLKWRLWFKDSVTYYDLKVQEINNNIYAYSQDAQTMEAQLIVQYKIMPDKIIQINEEYGSIESLEQKLSSVFMEKCKVVLASSSAMKIIEKRDSLSKTVEEQINQGVSQYYVTITMVLVNDIEFNEAFESAVEQKMIAEQQQLQAEYDKQKAIIKAEEELEVAKLAAEALLASETATAEGKKIVAQAQAEAIKVKSIEIARMLGFNIDEDGNIDFTGKSNEEISIISEYLKYVEYLEKWDGKLPQVVGDSTSIIMPDLDK